MEAAEGKNKRKVGTASTEETAGKPEKPYGRNIINGRSSITTSGIVLTAVTENGRTAEINGKHGSKGKISGTIDYSPVLPESETGETAEIAGTAGITKTAISSSNDRI